MLGQQISAEELHALIVQGLPSDSIVVDVRMPVEFEKGAIAGAINIPVDTIASQVDQLRPYKKIYLYCLSGGRSQLAFAQLESMQLPAELYNVTSGLLAWRKNGFPLQTSAA
jgi:rhodanese-related sulfurtransferase